MKKLLLALLVALAPINLRADSDREKESDKGVAGAVNKTADIIIGTGCLIGAWLLFPKAYGSLKNAYAQSDGINWFLKKETWLGFFDGVYDNKERVVSSAYFEAIGWTSGTLALTGVGLKKVLRGTGIIK